MVFDDQHVSMASVSCTTITAIRISTAVPPLDSRPELARESAHRSHQLADLALAPECLAAVAVTLPCMTVAGRRTRRWSTVPPASPVRHRRSGPSRRAPAQQGASWHRSLLYTESGPVPKVRRLCPVPCHSWSTWAKRWRSFIGCLPMPPARLSACGGRQCTPPDPCCAAASTRRGQRARAG